MVNLPWAQNGCTTMVSSIHDVTRNVHRRGCPVISLLYYIETAKFVQNVVFMSQVVQPLTTPVTFFSVEINGAKRATEKMPPWLRRAPFDVTHPATESERPRGPLAVRTHEMSQNFVPSFRL